MATVNNQSCTTDSSQFWLIFLVALCPVGPNDDEDQQEKTLSQVYDHLPEGRTPLDILKNKEERQCIGKCQESRM